MNHVALIGRLVKDPIITYTQGEKATEIARYTLAVDRGAKDAKGQNLADFISCVAFNKQAEFAERYLTKGMKIAVEGRIQTGSYTNKDGQKVYTTDVIINRHEFVESKQQGQQNQPQEELNEGFMAIPEGVEEDGLPWN